jgi:hypothetical protein
MSLSRSAAGLAAEHLFHGVDIVVWTEGGDVSAEPPGDVPVAEGALLYSAPYGDDVQFWRAIFEKFQPRMKARFKPAGSKSRIKQIALEVESHKLANVVVCLDRDHDDLSGTQISDSNVVYTRWYSWENECWTDANVISAFEEIYSGTESPSDVLPLLAAQKQHLIRKLTWHVRADVLRSIAGIPRYLSRETNRISAHSGVAIPQLRTAHLLSNCGKGSRPRFRLLAGNEISVEAHCVGHILSNFYFHTLRALVHRHLGDALPRLSAKAIIVSVFRSKLGRNRRARAYYNPLLSSLRVNPTPVKKRGRRRRQAS